MEYTYIHTGIHTVKKGMNHFLDIKEQSGIGFQHTIQSRKQFKIY